MGNDHTRPEPPPWQALLNPDSASRVWPPAAALAAQPDGAALLNQLAAHAGVYAALAGAWTGAPGGTDRAPESSTDAPILAVQRSLLQPWLQLLAPRRAQPPPDTGRLFGWDLETWLDRLAHHPGDAQQLAQLRPAVAELLAALQDYLGIWSDLLDDALRQFAAAEPDVDAAGGTLRGAYDRWVDIAEARYAERAMTPEFARAQGRLINALVGLCKLERTLGQSVAKSAGGRADAQGEWESGVRELRRQLERLRAQITLQPPAAAGRGSRATP